MHQLAKTQHKYADIAHISRLLGRMSIHEMYKFARKKQKILFLYNKTTISMNIHAKQWPQPGKHSKNQHYLK